MGEIHMEPAEFDLKLAIECADSYSVSTGLGCTVSDTRGNVLHSTGRGCADCMLCELAGHDRTGCIQAHAYGMTEAERFGGKYIYFCPMGLTCFVSPILGSAGSAAKITVGPLLMVELDDYIAFELEQSLKLPPEQIARLLPTLREIPQITTAKVNALSNLLFMTVGFLNNVSQTNRMLENRDAELIQSQVSEYILALKHGESLPDYPLATEREMLTAIVKSDKTNAQRLLNELLGHILFASGGDFPRIKSRIYELLVLISRAAVDTGASPERSFRLTHDFFVSTAHIHNVDDLSLRLTQVMNQFIDSIFSFHDIKNADVMHKALQYMHQNYAKRISLDEVASRVHLSPSYFSKVFKRETGQNFNAYLNSLRIDHSKKLLLYQDIRLVAIASMVGFEDQSYFTKVFKRTTGISPHQYRKSGGTISANHTNNHIQEGITHVDTR